MMITDDYAEELLEQEIHDYESVMFTAERMADEDAMAEYEAECLRRTK